MLYDEDEEQAAAPAEQDEAAVPEEAVEPEPSARAGGAAEPEEPAEEEPAVEEPARTSRSPQLRPWPRKRRCRLPRPRPRSRSTPRATCAIPDGYSVLEGAPNGKRRTVAIVVSSFNGEITDQLLDSALLALDEAGVARDAVLVMPVPGAFELPLAAMALAKTRRYSCVVALGCVIRGETPHFDFVASEAASGLQLAGIETGVPVSFGLLTCDTAEQAEARVERGAGRRAPRSRWPTRSRSCARQLARG